MRINGVTRGAIIIAGSGMCTGGRIRHHFKHRLWLGNTHVIFIGYQASGTLGRLLVDGAKRIHLYHQPISVQAQIHTLGGFSAHADQQELLNWHAQTGAPERTFLVHGEEMAMQTLSGRLTGTKVETPGLHESFEL